MLHGLVRAVRPTHTGVQGVLSSGLSGFFVTPTSQCCASRPEGSRALPVDANRAADDICGSLSFGPAMAKSSGTQPRPKSELAHQGMNWMVLAPPRAQSTASPTIRWRLDGKVCKRYRTGPSPDRRYCRFRSDFRLRIDCERDGISLACSLRGCCFAARCMSEFAMLAGLATSVAIGPS